MNIYIVMEIKARELEGRMLLALAAAERGHRVLLGNITPLTRGSRPSALPPGVWHDKSLTPSASRREHTAKMAAEGFAITSQDEEHWLNLPTYDVPARKRYSAEMLGRASRAFAWGEHDATALRDHYPGQAASIVAVGSPRVDLWRKEFDDHFRAQPRPGTESHDRYVLVSSNYSTMLAVNPFWVRIRDARPRKFDGPDDPVEFDYYELTAMKARVLGRLVRGVRKLAAARPDLLVVVRPHPIEDRLAWRDLLGPIPNVLVTNTGGISGWIRGASAVIHNECTSGYEAAVSRVPVISYQPDGLFADYPSNALGRAAADEDSLIARVDEALDRDPSEPWGADSDRALLERRLSALDGSLATDRIVDQWDELDAPALSEAWSTGRVRAARRARRLRKTAVDLRDTAMRRQPIGTPFETAHKFPPVSRDEVLRIADGYRRTLGRFENVRIDHLADDLIAFTPTGARP